MDGTLSGLRSDALGGFAAALVKSNELLGAGIDDARA
jgi:hypothetical protein